METKVTSEWALVKAITAICGGIGAYFSLSKQESPYTLKSVFSFLTVGIVVSFFGTPIAVRYIAYSAPGVISDVDIMLSIAGLVSFVLGILSMNIAILIYNIGATLRDDPGKVIGWISDILLKVSSLFSRGEK